MHLEFGKKRFNYMIALNTKYTYILIYQNRILALTITMGQYYKIVILAEKPAPVPATNESVVETPAETIRLTPAETIRLTPAETIRLTPAETIRLTPAETIRLALNPHNYQQGSKITEHSYIGNELVSLAEYMISPLGMFYKSRLVWAGDYADSEPQTRQNLYHMSSDPQLLFNCSKKFCSEKYRYIVNHTKREFVDKQRCLEQYGDDYDGLVVHPLPHLVSEGNGRGSGDYTGPGEDDCGRWARDIISMERTHPTREKGYCEFITKFQPN